MVIRKFELHWDAAVVIALVVVVSLGFNLYQRYQYRSMISESLTNQLAAQEMRMGVTLLESALTKCRAGPAVTPQR